MGCSRGCEPSPGKFPKTSTPSTARLRTAILIPKSSARRFCDLRSLSAAVSSILKRHRSLDVIPEHEDLVRSALDDCEDAAKALRAVLERLQVDGISCRNVVSKLKVLSRRMLYPFQTETIAQLARDVGRCRGALHVVISFLNTDVTTSTIEQVREVDERLVKMDEKLAGNFARLERGSLDLNSFDRKNWKFDDLLVLLDRQAEIGRSEADERRARATVDTLAHPHLRRRWEDVPSAPQSTFAWLLHQLPLRFEIVNEFPGELEEYFRRMIMDRIHTAFLSDTAMAIRMAMLENRLSYFWFLSIYTDEGEPVIANSRFSLDTSFTPFDTDGEIEAMNLKARALISTCCRDILTVGACQPPRMLNGVSGDEFELDRIANLPPRDTFVTFTHRTVFNFLQTPEMHRVLSEHVPPHFEDRIVAVHLEIAQWKLADPERSLSAGGCGIAFIVENLAIDYLERSEDRAFSSISTSGLLADNMKRLVRHLARYDLYTFADRVAKADQSGEHRTTPLGESVPDSALLCFALGIQSRAGTHVELLRLMLQHPASIDPNALHRSAGKRGLVSPWYALLRRIDRNTLADGESSYKRTLGKDGEECAELGPSETFADAHIREAIALMIRHGADESVLDEFGLDRHDGKVMPV